VSEASPRIPKATGAVSLKTLLLEIVTPRRQAGRELASVAGQLAEAIKASRCGEHAKAHDIFWKLAENARSPRVAAIARYALGWVMARQGDLDDAAAVLSDNETRFIIAHRLNDLSASSAADLALVHALRGETRHAASWLDRADARRSLSFDSTDAAIAFARAVWLCRSDRALDAARLLDEGWAGYEAAMTGDVLRPLRIVRAFAHATGPRAGGVAEAALPTLRPAYPGEYAFLGAKWPEMAAFLASHELA
jgi:hypothetical protein